MRVADCNWMELERYLETDDRIVLPLGSVEQHGYHLPLDVDMRLSTAVCHGAGQAAAGERDGRKQIAHGFADGQQRSLRQPPTEKTTRDGPHERKDHSFAQDATEQLAPAHPRYCLDSRYS